MEVKEAIRTAEAYVTEVFEGEGVGDVELEETEFGNGEWRITVSFSRVLPAPAGASPSALEILAFAQARGRRRLHKVVIMNEAGKVLAMKDRAWMDAAG